MIRTLLSFLKIREDELHSVAFSFLYFFSILGSYYVLRPLRDEMAMQLGPNNLHESFLTVFLVMCAIVPMFGWLTRSFPRALILPWIYLFFAVNFVVFYLLFRVDGLQIRWVARTFFVWVSVYNLFVVSLFWSYMADIFSTEQAERLNGFISAGGTLGALLGPLLTASLVESFGVKNLILLSGVFLCLAIFCIFRLKKESGTRVALRIQKIEFASGFRGSIWSGLRDILLSSYLVAICGFLILYSLLSTFLYGISTEMIPRSFPDSLQRTKVLAQLDFTVNVVALLSQVLIFNGFIDKYGRRAALVFLPVLSIVGFTILSVSESIAALFVFGILRRAGEYSIAKPTRETLYNVLPASQKYRAKNIIDTMVHRFGDASSASLYSFFQKMNWGSHGISALSVLLSGLWCVVAMWLGKKAEQLLRDAEEP